MNLEKIKKATSEMLEAFGEDLNRPGIVETPKRVSKAWGEMLSGYDEDPNKHLKLFEEKSTSLTIIKDLNFTSVCEHHLMPFSGKINIGYIPNGKVLGLSKFSRISNTFAKRLQLQEKLTKDIFDFLKTGMEPSFLFVYIKATHDCIMCRGVNQKESETETLLWFSNDEKKQYNITEIMQLARGK